jgi:23S rRNA (uracil1939-C5)-methyltransferase
MTPPMAPSDVSIFRTVQIEWLDEEGRGVGTEDGRRVHVAGALPGETCTVAIEHRSPHRQDDWGRLVELGRRSPDRVEPACPAFGACGGCALQHWRYEAQLAWKREKLRFGGLATVVPSPKQLGYRNRAKLVVGPGPVLGSYAPASHRLVDMAGCRVPEPAIEPVLEALRPRLAAIEVYDERSRRGELRYVMARANHGGEVQVVLVTRSTGPWAALVEIARGLRRERPEVTGVVHDVNETTGGGIAGGHWETLDGEAWLEERVGDVSLRLSPLAFFQVNRDQAARLYADAAARAGEGRVIDLFSGAGGIALTAAAKGARVVGVESHAGAVEDARVSAKGGAEFLVGDAAAGLPRAIERLGGVDAIIVDPPRRGLGREGIAAILSADAPRVVYVSCNPISLMEDLSRLQERYRPVEIVGYDLMPGTPHIEVLVELVR